MKTQYKTIDEYIKTFPVDIQGILEKMKQTIREAAPEAIETISYQMPTFKLNGNLVYFAAFKNHIGFYPPLQELNNLRKNYHRIEGQKVPCNSHWINLFHSP